MNEANRPRVLIADDENHIRLLMKSAMAKVGFQVIGLATDGQEAVDLFQKTKPDLLLLDINMPVKTGEVALKEILSQNPDANIIMLTSVADTETVMECINMGAANYIRKDTPLKEIVNIVKDTWVASRKAGS